MSELMRVKLGEPCRVYFSSLEGFGAWPLIQVREVELPDDKTMGFPVYFARSTDGSIKVWPHLDETRGSITIVREP